MYSLYRAWLSFGPGSSSLQPPPPLPPIQPAAGGSSPSISSLPTSQQLNLAAVAAAATAAAAAVQLPPIVAGAPDVSLQVGPNMTQFSAHKAVLSAHSGYFKAALTHSNESSTPISVPNVNVDEFSSLLTFMYTGYLDLNIGNIYSILLATHILHMPRALEICRSFLLHSQSAAAAVAALETRVNVIKPIPSKKIPPATQEIHPPAFGRLNKSEDTPFRTVGNSTEVGGEQKRKSPLEPETKVSYNNNEKPATKTEKKTQDRKTKKRFESSSSEKVIVDIACCDGPVKFHRVVNKDYGLQSPASEPYEKDEINNRNVAMNKAMNENIREKQQGDENENLQQNNEIFTCLYCNHTFKSQYCYQKHARRHLNPVSLEVKTARSAKELKREVKLLDMNVQYYPCKICGSKFPSYYFVHKHRKMCHSEDVENKNETVSQNDTEHTDSSSCSAIDVEAINNDK